ncbi:MAG: cell envelope integrity protein CreD [Polaromonas sp.]|uniref:cell envelope integrity protein CreD n=1 Tax=Polaromonas sp. TaxID=1869339 RepID=UPI0025E0BDEC|nr:cell envelope integrity protein CreD [Polaromonas sp.]MBI2728095.1 cell envelope integrity protein CreD [Polaromonas sp.]
MKHKLVSLGGVFLLLLMGLFYISGIVHDRQTYRQAAVDGVARSLAGAQTLTGPLVQMACTEEWAYKEEDKAKNGRREFTVVAAPASLNVGGNARLEERARGLHAVQVFELKTRITAQWPDFRALTPVAKNPNARVSCGQPLLVVSVSDARGVRHAKVTMDGQAVTLKPGTLWNAYPRGVHAPLPGGAARQSPLDVVVDLELVGTERLSVVPVGADTVVKLESNWAHPSFNGQFLPADRQVGAAGFSANWRVSTLASSAQLAVADGRGICSSQGDAGPASGGNCTEAFGVSFIDPANTYALSDKATKYGLLFIGLTFLAVGLFEFMKALRVHPIQYLLVGAAMSMFFLLLVSLSEHMPFERAYAVASAACVLLLTYYASHMLGRWSRGLPFGAGIAMLYGMLFVLLRMEQTALLLGAVTLFAVLAFVMTLTRRVDWYARFKSTEKGEASSATRHVVEVAA